MLFRTFLVMKIKKIYFVDLYQLYRGKSIEYEIKTMIIFQMLIKILFQLLYNNKNIIIKSFYARLLKWNFKVIDELHYNNFNISITI